VGAGAPPVAAMEHDEIQALLAAIEPSDAIPTPPGMRAIPVSLVLDAGADPDELDGWIKGQGGWMRRMPAQFLPPEATDRDALFYVLPEKSLEGGPPPKPATLPKAHLIAFAATTNLPRARVFYEKGLGLKVSGESPIACTFDANGTTLRVIAVEKATIAPYTVLGWSVADIGETVRELIGRGVAFERIEGIEQNELGVWRSPGSAQVAWFKDPDGNMLSLTQF
jgi:catechol 2,3-dioxygenase-like lactoylglutathione lyase family enzyme